MPWLRVSRLAILLALIPLCSCDECIWSDKDRFDCLPHDASPTFDKCSSRLCCWIKNTHSGDAGNVRKLVDAPHCFFPTDYSSYSVTSWKETYYGFTASLSRTTSPKWPMDIKTLSLEIWFETDKRIHFKVGGNLSFVLLLS